MKHSYKVFAALLILILLNNTTRAQTPVLSNISGNFEVVGQFYRTDSAIGAPEVPEKFLNNAFLNLNYVNGNFKVGLRYEEYLGPLLGFDERYRGSGITYRFAQFTNDRIDITAGNFYDQFGNGLIFRCYEERALGIDNSMDGIRVGVKPIEGIYIKGVVGRQRDFFSLGEGLVRGIDGDVQLNELFLSLKDSRIRIGIGGSFVSKYQKDNDQLRNLPENVGASAARLNLNTGKFSLSAEYAYKINDPSVANGFIYKPGEAIYLNMAYTTKGFGTTITGKRIDNMNFRSDRNATLNSLMINYLPAISKQYSYRLLTLYPYTTQPNGEIAGAAEVFYNFAAKTPLGGKYGTKISLGVSGVNNIDTVAASNDTLGYESNYFKIGSPLYYQDLSLEINKKISKKVKLIGTYVYQAYNKDVVEGEIGFGIVHASIAILDVTYKFNSKNSIRMEIQHLSTHQDRKNWAMMLLEYTISPNWAFTVFDEYNYGSDNPDERTHFYNATMGYTRSATRISLGYVRQRAGLLCVGGVCRFVPASNGLGINITSRF